MREPLPGADAPGGKIMNQIDADRASADGYAAGRNDEPSRPPNDHGLLYDVAFKSQREARADDAYREAYRKGAQDRKRHR